MPAMALAAATAGQGKLNQRAKAIPIIQAIPSRDKRGTSKSPDGKFYHSWENKVNAVRRNLRLTDKGLV